MRKAGFTVIELLIVVVVVGIIASIVLAEVGSLRGAAYVTALKNDLRHLATAESLHHDEHGTYAQPDAVPGFYFSDGVSVSEGAADNDSWSATLEHERVEDTCSLEYGYGDEVDNKIRCTSD